MPSQKLSDKIQGVPRKVLGSARSGDSGTYALYVCIQEYSLKSTETLKKGR